METLFHASVLNPIGTVPIVCTMDDDAKERSRISLWTAINVFIIYYFF
jgi:multiple antibiotic resistance protein